MSNDVEHPSYIYLPSVYPLWASASLSLCPLFTGWFEYWVSLMCILYAFQGKILCWYVICKHFPPDCSLSFLPLHHVFHRHLRFLMKFKWLIIHLTGHAFGVVFESLPNKVIENVPPMFSSSCFMALGFTFSLWPILS